MAISTIKGSGFKTVGTDTTYNCSQGNTWEYTGVSITIPPHTAYGLRGHALFSHSQNLNVAFCISNNDFSYYNRLAMAGQDGENGGYVFITGYNGNDNSVTYYLWGKWANSALNSVGIFGWLYTP